MLADALGLKPSRLTPRMGQRVAMLNHRLHVGADGVPRILEGFLLSVASNVQSWEHRTEGVEAITVRLNNDV